MGGSSSECKRCPVSICPVSVQVPRSSDYSTTAAYREALKSYNKVKKTKNKYISVSDYNEAKKIATESFSNIVNNKIGITQHMVILSILIILGYSIIKNKL